MVVRWSLTVDYNGRRQNVRKDVMFFLLPPATKLMQDVCDSVHRGVPAPRGVCSWGVPMGVPGPGGVYSRGLPGPRGAGLGGLLLGGAWSGGSGPRGVPGRDPPPPSWVGYCCGRYTSYWNAFLLSVVLTYRVTFVIMNNRIDRK